MFNFDYLSKVSDFIETYNLHPVQYLFFNTKQCNEVDEFAKSLGATGFLESKMDGHDEFKEVQFGRVTFRIVNVDKL